MCDTVSVDTRRRTLTCVITTWSCTLSQQYETSTVGRLRMSDTRQASRISGPTHAGVRLAPDGTTACHHVLE